MCTTNPTSQSQTTLIELLFHRPLFLNPCRPLTLLCDVVALVPSQCKQNGRIVGDGRFISHLRRWSAFGIKKESTGGAEDRFFTTMNQAQLGKYFHLQTSRPQVVKLVGSFQGRVLAVCLTDAPEAFTAPIPLVMINFENLIWIENASLGAFIVSPFPVKLSNGSLGGLRHLVQCVGASAGWCGNRNMVGAEIAVQ